MCTTENPLGLEGDSLRFVEAHLDGHPRQDLELVELLHFGRHHVGEHVALAAAGVRRRRHVDRRVEHLHRHREPAADGEGVVAP